MSDAEIKKRVTDFRKSFDVQPDCPPEELERAARTSVALDRLVEIHNLGSLAYYYQGTGNAENEDAISSIILGTSLLTARGIPVAGEYEIKNAQAMKIMDSFGAGGSFTEYYAADFNDDVLLMGHDGPGPYRHRGRQDQGSSAQGLSRQSRPRTVGRNVGQAWSGDAFVGDSNCRWKVEAADGGRRVRCRTDSRDREHQQPLPVLDWGKKFHERMERARPGASLRGRCGAHCGQAEKAWRLDRYRMHSSVLTSAWRSEVRIPRMI